LPALRKDGRGQKEAKQEKTKQEKTKQEETKIDVATPPSAADVYDFSKTQLNAVAYAFSSGGWLLRGLLDRYLQLTDTDHLVAETDLQHALFVGGIVRDWVQQVMVDASVPGTVRIAAQRYGPALWTDKGAEIVLVFPKSFGSISIGMALKKQKYVSGGQHRAGHLEKYTYVPVH